MGLVGTIKSIISTGNEIKTSLDEIESKLQLLESGDNSISVSKLDSQIRKTSRDFKSTTEKAHSILSKNPFLESQYKEYKPLVKKGEERILGYQERIQKIKDKLDPPTDEDYTAAFEVLNSTKAVLDTAIENWKKQKCTSEDLCKILDSLKNTIENDVAITNYLNKSDAQEYRDCLLGYQTYLNGAVDTYKKVACTVAEPQGYFSMFTDYIADATSSLIAGNFGYEEENTPPNTESIEQLVPFMIDDKCKPKPKTQIDDFEESETPLPQTKGRTAVKVAIAATALTGAGYLAYKKLKKNRKVKVSTKTKLRK